MTVQESVEIAHTGGEFAIEIESNFDIRVEPMTDWIEFDRVEGNKAWFTADPNGYTGNREGQVKFADAKDRYYYKVSKVIQTGDPNPKTSLRIVDKNATPETKALFANLWAIAEKGRHRDRCESRNGSHRVVRYPATVGIGTLSRICHIRRNAGVLRLYHKKP
jgi:hypothetical protein